MLVDWSLENIEKDGKLSDLENGKLAILREDGYQGYAPAGPYDAIHVGAAPERIPEPLLEQLKVGGCLLIPVGPAEGNQEFVKIVKRQDGSYQSESLFGVRYVPLTTLEQQLNR
eukprot:CAMPEP_0185777172 /NCGR_PEP_ID=MMETSP1174-20130828/88511_1 /TAXON_ID=35687 /ORGANISM="Dictyocha speculum, Strain CCMP1381" /LENGTH=113 /DNA_ID=CAMNT_0028465451 /DNA_START=423 /DNA_END=764 /DNA_ORIENTATION=-